MNEQIGNKINDKTYIKLTPFKGFVLENFPFIEADFDAITNYQLLCKIVEYLNNVISNQNQVQELGTELVTAYNTLVDAVNLAINEFETDITGDFNDLKDYVDNYFDNNFPELISDKLDEMAEDGTLENLLNDVAHLTKSYNTYTDLIADSENFTNGLRLKTLGYYEINDGGAAEYIVTNSSDINNYQVELTNSLYLNLIDNGIINVKQLGAYGDNTHDDTNIIQSALNYANSKNKIVIIKNGIFLTNELTSNSVIIKGDNATLKALSNTNNSLLTITGKATINNLTFDGDNKINNLLHLNGIESELYNLTFKNNINYAIDNTMNTDNDEIAHIENVTFLNCGGGINITGKTYDNPDDYKGRVEFINCKTLGNTGNSENNRLYFFTKLNYVYVNGGEFTGNSTYGATNIYQVNHGEVIGGYYHDIKRGVTLGLITKNCIISNTINENISSGGGLHIDLVTSDRVHPLGHSIITNNIIKNAYRGMFIQGKNIVLNNNYIYCGNNTASSGGILRFNDDDNNTDKSNVTLDNTYIYNLGNIEQIIICSTAIINVGKLYVNGTNIDYASFQSDNLCYKLNKNIIAGNGTSYYLKLDDEILIINASASTNIFLPGTGDSKICGRKIIIIRTDDTTNTISLRCRSDKGTINGLSSATANARIYKGVNEIIQTGAGEYWTITPSIN